MLAKKHIPLINLVLNERSQAQSPFLSEQEMFTRRVLSLIFLYLESIRYNS